MPYLSFCCDENEIYSQYPAIECFEDWNIDFLLDEGEKNLLSGNAIKAEEHFTKAIILCELRQNQEIRLCRALFSRSLSNAILNFQEQALDDVYYLQKILEQFQCTSDEYTVEGKPILGPDEISVQECLDRVNDTVGITKDLLGLAPVDSKWKIAMILALNQTADKAKRCCRSGGVWKACLQPLLSKWLELKDWERECRRLNRWFYLPSVD